MDICSNLDEEDDTKRDNNASYKVQDVFQALNETQRWRKSDQVDSAKICPLSKKIQLLTTRTNINKNHGYVLGGKRFLYPEEALYFLEIFKLELLLDRFPLSVERGRSLLLRPDSIPYACFDGSTCTISEYTVYKYLAKQGYRPRRPNYIYAQLKAAFSFEEDTPEEEVSAAPDFEMMGEEPEQFIDDNEEMEAGNGEAHGCRKDAESPSNPNTSPSSNGKRKLIPPSTVGIATTSAGKRAKFKIGDGIEENLAESSGSPQAGSSSSNSSTSPEIICDYERISDPSSVKVAYCSGEGEETIYELDPSSSFYCSTSYNTEPQPSTSRGFEAYTVEEADSDVEFVDEVIFCHVGVDIEEIPNSEDEELPDIPRPSSLPQSTSFTTLRSPTKDHVFVDLVSSDDEDEVPEKNTLRDFSDHIWSRFVPKAKKMGFPPAELIPKEIRRSDKDSVSSDTYLKTDEDCDLELKEIVDGLKLGSDSPENPSAKTARRNRAKSWRDWRQQEAKEIRNIFRGSLFGSTTTSEDSNKAGLDCDKIKRINRWPPNNSSDTDFTNHNASSNGLENSYTYDLFLPSENKFGKNLLGTQVKPSYRVIIKQETDVFLDFSKLAARKDEVPFLIAVVNEDQQVAFVSPGNSDIQDMFRQPNSVKN